MKPDYDEMLAHLATRYLDTNDSDDFFRQLKFARDTAIIRLLKVGLSLREVANLDAGQIKRLPVPRQEAAGTVTHSIEVIRNQPIQISLDAAAVKSLHHYLMLRGSQKRTVFLRIRKQTPISHTDIVIMLNEIKRALPGQLSPKTETLKGAK